MTRTKSKITTIVLILAGSIPLLVGGHEAISQNPTFPASPDWESDLLIAMGITTILSAIAMNDRNKLIHEKLRLAERFDHAQERALLNGEERDREREAKESLEKAKKLLEEDKEECREQIVGLQEEVKWTRSKMQECRSRVRAIADLFRVQYNDPDTGQVRYLSYSEIKGRKLWEIRDKLTAQKG